MNLTEKLKEKYKKILNDLKEAGVTEPFSRDYLRLI